MFGKKKDEVTVTNSFETTEDSVNQEIHDFIKNSEELNSASEIFNALMNDMKTLIRNGEVNTEAFVHARENLRVGNKVSKTAINMVNTKILPLKLKRDSIRAQQQRDVEYAKIEAVKGSLPQTTVTTVEPKKIEAKPALGTITYGE